MNVAVLFARADSVYKTLPGCDVWDADRDALKWPGGMPVVAHPDGDRYYARTLAAKTLGFIDNAMKAQGDAA